MLSLADRWIVEFDRALRTLSGVAHPSRPSPAQGEDLTEMVPEERSKSGALMRVDHSGEVCAQALYSGQALTARDPAKREALLQAAREEGDHLAWTRGLLVCLFSAEEWALAGSRQWLAAMTPEVRNRLVIDLNLDTVGADPRLTALTSGFSGLERFVADSARAAGHPVAIHPVPMANSDHANFAAHGIPALRLIAGFGQPDSRVRHILTAQDTRDKVAPAELATAARVAACMLWQALCATDEDVASWR